MNAVRTGVLVATTAVLAACTAEGETGWERYGEPVDDAEFAMTPGPFRSNEGLEVWFTESDGGEMAYVVEPDGDAEAWPRNDGVACA